MSKTYNLLSHVVFFDIGQTLGNVIISEGEIKLETFPDIKNILSELSINARLGVISKIGGYEATIVRQMMRDSGIFEFFEPALVHFITGDNPKNKLEFEKALNKAGINPQMSIFIGEDPLEREEASKAGMRVAARAGDAINMLRNVDLQYVKIDVLPEHRSQAWQNVLLTYGVDPLYITGDGSVIYARASPETIKMLHHTVAWFRILPLGSVGAPYTTDLYLLKDVPPPPDGFLGIWEKYAPGFDEASQDWILEKNRDGGVDVVYVAIPVGLSIEDFHFEGTHNHGHTLKLMPSRALLSSYSQTTDSRLDVEEESFFASAASGLEEADVQLIRSEINDELIRQHIKKYSSVVKSRHIHHPGNKEAVKLLVQDLSLILGSQFVSVDRFLHEGKILENVIGLIPGQTAEIVIICAHLDSTGANHSGYNAKKDPAPGADDDASGIAAVLAAAKAISELIKTHGKPACTIHFALFNAEEHGLVGSRAYADKMFDSRALIAGVFQIDMIGYDRNAPSGWEIHFGYGPDPSTQKKSGKLADLIQTVTPLVVPAFLPPQIFPQLPSQPDPADRRSDHASFQMVGYPACVISEDFFPAVIDEDPTADANPHYHLPTDELSEINIGYATKITQIITASVWVLAGKKLNNLLISNNNYSTNMAKNYDSRNFNSKRPGKGFSSKIADNENPEKKVLGFDPDIISAGNKNINLMTGMPRSLNEQPSGPQSIFQRALKYVSDQLSGFAETEPADFIPDPLVLETSAGTKIVNLHQYYLGIPVFQMTRNVQFTAYGTNLESEGDSIPPPVEMNIVPAVNLLDATVSSVEHILEMLKEEVTSPADHSAHDPYNLPPDSYTDELPAEQPNRVEINLNDYIPKYVYSFSDAAQRSILGWVKKDGLQDIVPEVSPMGAYIPANLTVFYLGDSTRLGWELLITLPDQTDQYRVIWPADDPASTGPLYCRQTASSIKGLGYVYPFSPRAEDTPQPVATTFPLDPSFYPVARNLGKPVADLLFPRDWCDNVDAIGNNTMATRGNTLTTFKGSITNEEVTYQPADSVGDEQKILNIFFFCNYMHDFFYLLGFDEGNGNFQKQNFTGNGNPGDAVKARAHPGTVNGTANMLTPPDGQSAIMNMGLVAGTNRHTAFDADVVFHEFCHGVTNRLVGGRMNSSALEQEQSSGMGEGWSDYFALTIQNFHKTIETERRVTGDWVTNRRTGIRGFPYGPRNAANEPDAAKRFPDSFGQLGKGRYSEEHNVGEIWCAALMHMNRMIGTRMNNYKLGHQVGWQIVVDGLKLTRANPSFLDARNAILKALDELNISGKLNSVDYKKARKGAWEAFAEFGMGVSAYCPNASLMGVQETFDLPVDL